MSWLKAFEEAAEIGFDKTAEKYKKQRDKAKTPIERFIAEEVFLEYMRLRRPAGSAIVHPIPSRFLQLVKIPEIPDPDKDYFI